MLETQFPRLLGDIGNPKTFTFPVVYDVVQDASVDRVVTGSGLSPDLLKRFIGRARYLQQKGAKVIATSCGFLYPHQEQLSEAVNVPVLTSSLCLLPFLRSTLAPERFIGVLTYDSGKLRRTLRADVRENLLIEGIELGDELHAVIAEDRQSINQTRARTDVIKATDQLIRRASGLAAIIIECTNISPYRNTVSAVAGVPVYDISDPISWIAARHPGSHKTTINLL